MKKNSIYNNEEAKIQLMNLYEEKLASLNIDVENKDVNTNFGRTRVVVSGNHQGKKLVLFHGFNAGAPITLEPIKDLLNDYHVFIVETVGQATKSEDFHMNIHDDSFGKWAKEVLQNLNISSVTVIGISYGAFIARKLIQFSDDNIEKMVLLVPSGIVNGNIGESMRKLTFPLMLWKITKKEKYLKKFLSAFMPKNDEFMFRMLSMMLKGTNLDTRIPKLAKPIDLKNFVKPVYVIAADNDIYFPGQKVIDRSKELFVNLQGSYLLKDCNHMPSLKAGNEIQRKLREWL